MNVVAVFNGMPADDLGAVQWRKSGRSNSTGNCVEFARVGVRVAVRDSKNPHGPALVFDRAEVAELVAGGDVVAGVLLLRWAGGLVLNLAGSPATPTDFVRFDLMLYSPLCLALWTAAAVVAHRGRRLAP